MSRSLSLIPLLLFILIFLGSGVYLHFQNVEFAFYQVPAPAAILPAVILAVIIGKIIQKNSFSDQAEILVRGIGHHDIILMCVIFLLSGAFSHVTKSTGCIEATVHLIQSFLPQYLLLPGIFIISAFISTAIGTSMGTIATVAPIAVGIAGESGLHLALTIGTVVGGAIFGDNLSTISDVTIAAAQSQKARFSDKFRYNGWIAAISALCTLAVIMTFFPQNSGSLTVDLASVQSSDFKNIIGAMPYIFILILSLCRLHVFIVLTSGLIVAGLVGGLANQSYSLILYAKDIYAGFASMNEIMVLSLFVGGLSEMVNQQGGIALITEGIHKIIGKSSHKIAELAIGCMAAFNGICIANNTIAVILAGPISRNIALQHRIPAYVSATWLDVFSCVVQGIIPYGAQILLASSIANLSPLDVPQYVFYCYILGGISVAKIMFGRKRKHILE